jgi:hypothetical protein
MFVRSSRSLIVATMLMAMISAVMAHRAPGSLTTIEWNENSQRTEVVHRLHTHDAETGVSSTLGMNGLSVARIEDRAQIALYVEEHFHIRSGERELQLDLIGAELSGDYLHVYQEYRGRLPRDILVKDSILLDVFHQQINQVNISDGDAVRSLVFSKDVDWLGYRFVD